MYVCSVLRTCVHVCVCAYVYTCVVSSPDPSGACARGESWDETSVCVCVCVCVRMRVHEHNLTKHDIAKLTLQLLHMAAMFL